MEGFCGCWDRVLDIWSWEDGLKVVLRVLVGYIIIVEALEKKKEGLASINHSVGRDAWLKRLASTNQGESLIVDHNKHERVLLAGSVPAYQFGFYTEK